MDKRINHNHIRFLLSHSHQSILAPIILFQYKALLEFVNSCLHSSEAVELLDRLNSSFPYKLYTNLAGMKSGLDIANLLDNYKPVSLAYDSESLVYRKHIRDYNSHHDFIIACIPYGYPTEVQLISEVDPNPTVYNRVFEVNLGLTNCELVIDKLNLVNEAIYVPTEVREHRSVLKSARRVYAGEKR